MMPNLKENKATTAGSAPEKYSIQEDEQFDAWRITNRAEEVPQQNCHNLYQEERKPNIDESSQPIPPPRWSYE